MENLDIDFLYLDAIETFKNGIQARSYLDKLYNIDSSKVVAVPSSVKVINHHDFETFPFTQVKLVLFLQEKEIGYYCAEYNTDGSFRDDFIEYNILWEY